MACKNSFSRLLIVSFGFLFLAACGGGGGSTTPTATTVTKTTTMTTAAEVPVPIPPPAGSEISGTGTITLNTATNAVTGTMTITGAFARVTLAHIHDGDVGVAGPIVIGLQDNGGGNWIVPPGSVFTAPQAARFLAGGYYLNAHTPPLNGGGEIRGQLAP